VSATRSDRRGDLDRCPVCAEPAGATVFSADRVPVLCNVLLPTAEEARRAPTGAVDLVLCPACGMLWNAAFDASVVEYSPAYENSLHFSPRFQEFATELAAGLVERHALVGRTVLEVGSGKGDFLAMLCDAGAGRGIGYDPSYGGETPARPELRFEPTLFPTEDFPDADLVCARHVFEHLATPGQVLGDLRAAIPPGRTVGFYVEVPDGAYLLREVALWDVIYEHPLHFTAPALGRLFADAGLVVTRLGTSFGGQYLAVEASTGGPASAAVDAAPDPDALAGMAATFRDRAASLRAEWSQRLADLATRGPVALWGAGSKGVSFLATVEGAGDVAAVVDVNPRKHGRHVPVTGHEVVGPAALASLRPRAVVVLNPVYRDEIAAMLSDVGVDAEIVVGQPA
jgi:SAM-dependent methyltransferase